MQKHLIILSILTISLCLISAASPSNSDYQKKQTFDELLDSYTPSNGFLQKQISSIKYLSDDNSRTENNCFEVVKDTNGNSATIDIPTKGQWWSTYTIKVTLKNTCSTREIVENLMLGIKSIKINSNSVGKSILWVGEIGSPWINMSYPEYDETYDTNYIILNCSDWVKQSKIAPNTSHIFTFNGSGNYLIESITFDSVVKKTFQSTTGNLIVKIDKIPSLNLNPSVILYDSSNTKISSATLLSTSETNEVSFLNISISEIYYVVVQGVSDSFNKKEAYTPIKIENITIEEDKTTTVIGEYKLVELAQTIITHKGYASDSGVEVSISSSNENYAFIKSATDAGSAKTTLAIPSEETYSLSIKPKDRSYTVELSNSIISAEVNTITATYTKSDKPEPVISNGIAGYFPTWGGNLSIDLEKIPKYVTTILFAFAKPSLTYTSGSFSNTGLEFSITFNEVKALISSNRKSNPQRKYLISFGGATYPWSGPNYSAMVKLSDDLGVDGIDIDYESSSSCTDIDTTSVTCNTDEEIIGIITSLNKEIQSQNSNLVLTAAPFSVAACGTNNFPANICFSEGFSAFTAQWVNPLKAVGNLLESIFIMTYDAGLTFDPNYAFDAYKSIYNGNIYTGLEVPPEGWGNHVLTVDSAKNYYKHNVDNGGSGVFIWSLRKNGNMNGISVTAYTYLKEICTAFKVNDECN